MFVYNFYDKLIESTSYYSNDSIRNRTTYKNDINNNLIEEKSYDDANMISFKKIIAYDDSNRIKKVVIFSANLKPIFEHDDCKYSTNYYFYNSIGLKSKITSLNNECDNYKNYESTTNFKYDNKGMLIEEIYLNHYDTTDYSRTNYNYDSNGNEILVEKLNYLNVTFEKTVNKYDKYGNIIESINNEFYYNNEFKTEYIYSK